MAFGFLFWNFCKVALMAYFDLKWTAWPLDQEVWSLDFDRQILFTFKWTLPTFHLMAPSTHILRKSGFEIIEKVSDGWHQTMLRDIEMNFFIITKQKLCGNFRSRSRFMLRFPNDSITLRIISTNESRLQHSFNLCSKRHSLLHLLVNFKTEDKEKTGTRPSSFSRSNVFFCQFFVTNYWLLLVVF